LKPEQDERGERNPDHESSDMRPQALALMSGALSRHSFARSPDAKSKLESHEKHQDKQRPENCVKVFSVFT
jgi:hypothetical protein